MDIQELTLKYEQLEQQWENTSNKLKEMEVLNQQLQQAIDEKNKQIQSLEKEKTLLLDEVEQLNLSANDLIQNKKSNVKKLNDLDKKYQALKEEYLQIKQKLKNRDLQIQEQETEYKSKIGLFSQETQSLITSYENKIHQLEINKEIQQVDGGIQTELIEEEQNEKVEKKVDRSGTTYLKLLLLSIVAHPIFYLLYRKNRIR